MTWTLLVFVTSATLNNPQPISQLAAPGFQTRTGCLEAATTWKNRLKPHSVVTECVQAK